ncbi:MAG: type IX secretion system membrane protein PorP/SprF [Bacteroidota bacterium]|nr:type IX secretion system membrane protein PorP/SprF [Bacteroidota bacterium]
MRVTIVLFTMMLLHTAYAQQLTQYTQYVFNHFSVNPAVAGSKECLDVRLGVRQQWAGFEGAPRTGWASLHGMIRSRKKPYVTNRHGIGAFAEADNAGNWGYSRFLLAYAYHIKLMDDTYLAFGAFAGVQQMKFDIGNVYALDNNDPAVDGVASALVLPEITPGVWWYNKNAWAGASLHNALGNRMGGIGETARLSRHFMISGGYRYKFGPRMALISSTLLKKSGGSPLAIDLNLMAEWNRTFALGAGYRGGDALTLLMKLTFLKYIQFGYSFDLTTSKMRISSSNTHEFILGITPCGREDGGRRMISCPAFE